MGEEVRLSQKKQNQAKQWKVHDRIGKINIFFLLNLDCEPRGGRYHLIFFLKLTLQRDDESPTAPTQLYQITAPTTQQANR